MNAFNKKIIHIWQGLDHEVRSSFSFTKLWFNLFLQDNEIEFNLDKNAVSVAEDLKTLKTEESRRYSK